MVISIAIIVFSSLWVLLDSNKLWKHPAVKDTEDNGPRDWFLGSLLFWIVVFPYYILRRASLKKVAPGKISVVPTVIGFIIILAFIFNIMSPYLDRFTKISEFSKMSTAELQEQVLKSTQEWFSGKEEFKSVQVRSVTLVHSQGNHYSGMVEVVGEGAILTRGIDVTYDGDQFIWQLR